MCEDCMKEKYRFRYDEYNIGDVVMSKVDLKVYFVNSHKNRCLIICHEVDDKFDPISDNLVEVRIADLQDMTFEYVH